MWTLNYNQYECYKRIRVFKVWYKSKIQSVDNKCQGHLSKKGL